MTYLRFKIKLYFLAIFVVLNIIGHHTLFAQESLYRQLWQDPEVEKRISKGIKANRMGEATLRFIDKNGKPVKNVSVQIAQISHDFLFGSTLFMLNGFPTPEQNQKYEEVFLSLFNHGTIPFYWAPLEPEPGQLRFAKNSRYIYRRPPPDVLLEFCEKNNIYPKGHTLVWDNPQWSIPDWLPKEEEKIQPLIDKRIEQIATRYGDKIQMWDVVNEIKNRHMDVPMPKSFAFLAFKKANQAFPKESILMINETTSIWYDIKGEYSFYYLAIENLLLKGARIDAIGLQCHFFHGDQEYKDVVSGKRMRPKEIFEVLDTYADFDKPLHITELTIPTIPNSPEGEKIQATVTRNLYRIWFSHPNVQSIVWWNMVDNTAAPGEDKWRGGFLKEDFTPKASYHVLNEMINKEWKTNLNLKGNPQGNVNFLGYYGKYQITAQAGNKTIKKTIALTKSGRREFTIQFD